MPAACQTDGADEVIDYGTDDFTRRRERDDVLFDIGGNRPLAECRRVMAEHGILVVVGAPAGRWIAPATRLIKAAALSAVVKQRLVPFISKNDRASVVLLKELAEAGKIRPVIDREYAFNATGQAINHVGAGRAQGKVIIKVQ